MKYVASSYLHLFKSMTAVSLFLRFEVAELVRFETDPHLWVNLSNSFGKFLATVYPPLHSNSDLTLQFTSLLIWNYASLELNISIKMMPWNDDA